jgi:hypothetical protein
MIEQIAFFKQVMDPQGAVITFQVFAAGVGPFFCFNTVDLF